MSRSMTDAERAILMEKLVETATHANAVFNSMEQTVALFERSLQIMNIGIEVWIPVGEIQVYGSHRAVPVEIGYARLRSADPMMVGHRGWCVQIRVIDGKYTHIVPFIGGDRALQVIAVEYLPSIVMALQQRSEEFLVIVREATSMLAGAMLELGLEDTALKL